MKKTFLGKFVAAVTSVMLAASGFTTIPASAAGNIISNSTFDYSTTGWGTYQESGGKASLSTSNGMLALNVTSVGSINYGVQVFYDIVPLYQNGVYRLKYDISSSVNRTVEGMIQQNGGTYQAYTWKELSLTQQAQTVDYTFTMTAETDIMAKLVFNCGNYNENVGEHTIYLDNVSLELIDDSNVDYSSFKPYEPPIVINQVGYKPEQEKIAVFRNITNETEFSVVNADTNQTVYTGSLYGQQQNSSAGETNWLGDFSQVTEPGSYYITCGNLDDSYTFTISDNVYNSLVDDTVKMLYLQRCGTEVVDDKFGHPACHNTEAIIYGTNQKIDVSGGWHDAGDYGRYIVPAAKSIADLLYAYDENPELFGDNIGIPESGNGIPDVLDEVRYELEWMLKMQAESGGVYHKVTCENFPGYVMPQYETDQLIVTPVSTTATADFCASMALAYEFYNDIDSQFAKQCLTAAEKAWAFLEQNGFIMDNPEDITTGEYGDNSDSDERYWAAAQMYRATGEEKYLEKIEQSMVYTGLDWGLVGNYGNIAILTMDNIDTQSAVYTKIKNNFILQANNFCSYTETNPYGSPITKYNWGSNMTIANAGIVLGIAYDLTSSDRYVKAANATLNYLLGNNPNGVCYVTGYGTVSPQQPHHRPSMANNSPMKGMLVGGVNSNLEDSAAKAYLADTPAAKCYVDNWESYSTNEVTIYWNSPLTYLLALGEAPAQQEEEINGDIDLDGNVTTADVVMLQKYIVKAQTLSEAQGIKADLNKDGKINVFDLVEIKRIILYK